MSTCMTEGNSELSTVAAAQCGYHPLVVCPPAMNLSRFALRSESSLCMPRALAWHLATAHGICAFFLLQHFYGFTSRGHVMTWNSTALVVSSHGWDGMTDDMEQCMIPSLTDMDTGVWLGTGNNAIHTHNACNTCITGTGCH
jgi:hypothetical protein